MKHEISYFDPDGKVSFLEVSEERDWALAGNSAWNEKLKLGFSWKMERDGSSSVLSVQRASLREGGPCKFKDIIPGLGEISGREGDGGALVLPLDSGRLCLTSGKKELETWFDHFAQRAWQVSWSNMSFIGCFAGGKAMVAIIEGGKFDAGLRVRTCWGRRREYSVDAVFAVRDFQDEEPLAEDLSLIYAELPGDWRSIAKFYRCYAKERLKIPSLAEKAAKDDIDYSSRSITVRCRMSVKPLPCEIAGQTSENEPPVKVFMSFADIRKIADEFKRQKVGPAEFNLVGWNHGGHDGAFPQLFPAEKACGGDAELRKTIEHVKSLGYRINFHDNYYDAYSLANNVDMDDCCSQHDGRILKNGLLAGGQAYRLCAKTAAERYAPENLRKCAELGVDGAHYIDVISIIGMVKCYNPKHPLSRGGNAEFYKKIMRMQQELFKVSMSEGARDWALPELDRAYMVLNCMDVPFDCVDAAVPIFQIAYHGSVLYNNFREGINCFPGEKLYLLNLAWGGLPLIYFHHLFHPNWHADSGWANDLTLETQEKLEKDVARIKRMSDDVERLNPYRNLRIEDLVEHEGGALAQTVYENGKSVWSNFSSSEAVSPTGLKIPPMDFTAE